MAYNSIHSGPAVDAAVASLNEIQAVRTEVSGKLDQVDDLASQAAIDRGLAVQAKDAAQEAQTLADQRATDAQGSATAAEQARTASVTAKSGAEQARDAAAADAERAEIAAAQASAIAVGEFIDDEHASPGTVFSSEKVAATVQQVRDDLADPEKGAAAIGYQQEGEGAAPLLLLKRARQYLHGEEYYFIPNSGDVTEAGLKLLFEARRQNKRVELAAGDHHTTGTIDASGLTLEGVWSGYENAFGTRIIGDGSHTVLSTSVSGGNQSMTASIRNLAIEANGAAVGILSSYQVNTLFENIISKGALDAFQCGEASRSGPLWVQLRNVVGKGVNRGLVVRGNQWANANLFDSCLFTGSDAGADLAVSGGYGAIANNFINTEVAGDGVGIRLNGTSNTVMNGCYFESHSPSVHITGRCYGLALNDGAFGSLKNNNPVYPAFIYHDSDIGARVFVRGGYLVGAGAEAENLTFAHSRSPAIFTFNMMEPPVREMASGFKMYGPGLPNALGAVAHTDMYTPAWTAQNTNPTLGNGTLTGRYTITGKTVSVEIDLLIGSTTTVGAGSWFFSLPFMSATGIRATGTATIEAGSAPKLCVARINNSSTTCFVLTSENSNPVSGVIPIAWAAGHRLRLSITYHAL